MVHDNIFEVRTVTISRNVNNYKWHGYILRLHGGSQFTG